MIQQKVTRFLTLIIITVRLLGLTRHRIPDTMTTRVNSIFNQYTLAISQSIQPPFYVTSSRNPKVNKGEKRKGRGRNQKRIILDCDTAIGCLYVSDLMFIQHGVCHSLRTTQNATCYRTLCFLLRRVHNPI